AGTIGSIVFGQENTDLIAPSFLAKEFNKHKVRIARAASITANQIEEAFQTFLTRLTLYSEHIIDDDLPATARNSAADMAPGMTFISPLRFFQDETVDWR
ncbi:PIN domain-containing protein, partial [Bradyrhizobium sp. NBAIM08]|uniref:PIN domain-containing protein n=1 Tax=Bradyrhizobium sp. NBAIM08 TaxID=2793815 RepID=UPI001CD78E39